MSEVSAHPSFVGCPQHVREPLLTQVQQHHQIETAADKLVLRLGRERPGCYPQRPLERPTLQVYIPALDGCRSSRPTLLEQNFWWKTAQSLGWQPALQVVELHLVSCFTRELFYRRKLICASGCRFQEGILKKSVLLHGPVFTVLIVTSAATLLTV